MYISVVVEGLPGEGCQQVRVQQYLLSPLAGDLQVLTINISAGCEMATRLKLVISWKMVNKSKPATRSKLAKKYKLNRKQQKQQATSSKLTQTSKMTRTSCKLTKL